ncbi:YceI-like domain protein [Leptospira ryugenii]|uniref:YceI-like domain protein n=1 Tax=Leptospira ryugenii TaxID=1917863 RepID=A0A2P2DV86_9LEPT|nr:YceI-like domain protein [Leptospira ryugenii]
MSGQFNPISKKIHIEIELDGIKTDNKLQTSHLHENYFETNLYPIASFDGIVSETKETGEVEAIGTLELHGVRQGQVKLTGKVEKTKEGVEQISYFSIKLSDYKIQVPKLLFLKINPIIQVKLNLIWETPK